jgi:hypothetical protein
MSFNVAAAFFRSKRCTRVSLVVSLALASLLFFTSGAVMALDGIDLSNPPEESGEEAGEGGCSRLVQIKYPFLSCTNGEIGSADGDDSWEDNRQIPFMSVWTESDGYWGPSYNEM